MVSCRICNKILTTNPVNINCLAGNLECSLIIPVCGSIDCRMSAQARHERSGCKKRCGSMAPQKASGEVYTGHMLGVTVGQGLGSIYQKLPVQAKAPGSNTVYVEYISYTSTGMVLPSHMHGLTLEELLKLLPDSQSAGGGSAAGTAASASALRKELIYHGVQYCFDFTPPKDGSGQTVLMTLTCHSTCMMANILELSERLADKVEHDGLKVNEIVIFCYHYCSHAHKNCIDFNGALLTNCFGPEKYAVNVQLCKHQGNQRLGSLVLRSLLPQDTAG